MQNFITRTTFTVTRNALIFCLIALLTACSAARLAYGNGETLSYWWLNGYADFESDQKPWVKKRIATLFAWHRKTQLKAYSKVLASTQQRVQHPVTSAELLADYAELKKHALLLLDKALPDIADLALAMHPEQITNMEKKFASNNDTYRKDYLRGDLEQRQRFRYKKVMEQAEHWFGNFSREQEQFIKAASDARPLNNELWMAERLRRQKTLIALLRKIQAEKPARDAVMAMLREYAVTTMERTDHAEHQEFFDASRQGTAQLTALIINMTTPEQKTHAVKKLQQWIDDFNVLAG